MGDPDCVGEVMTVVAVTVGKRTGRKHWSPCLVLLITLNLRPRVTSDSRGERKEDWFLTHSLSLTLTGREEYVSVGVKEIFQNCEDQTNENSDDFGWSK